MLKVSSFDIFDTVLTRKIGSPQSSFLLLGRKLQKYDVLNCSAESFARVREEAENRAFKNAGGLDSAVSLESIYREVGFTLRLSEEQLQFLQRLEIQLEIELLKPIPKTVQLINQLRAQQRKIIFVSDMYLDSDLIKDRLRQFDLFREGDNLYLSREYQQSKLSGQIYKEVIRQEKVKAKEIVHCGNHKWSDVGSAKRSGLQVQPFLEGNLNRYEKLLESYTWTSEGLSSAMAGASRLTRLSFSEASPRENALREVAAGVAGPILAGFNLWILRRVKELGIKRLYFLARDGQILIDIFDRLMAKLDIECEICYLYGSRQAWLLPSLTVVNRSEIERVFPKAFDVDFLSPKILFSRFCISPDEIQAGLEKIKLYSQDWNRNLTQQEREQLREHILTDSDIQSLILERAAEKREILIQYLHQVKLTEPEKVGIVDLGTGATLHNALAAVLETCGIEPPTSFYLGLREDVSDSKYGLPEPYMYNVRQQLGFLNCCGLTTFMEMTCSADHGSVVGYKVCNGKVKPVLTSKANEAVIGWGYPIVRETILKFADNLLLDPTLLNVWGDIRVATRTLLSLFWSDPTIEEAKAWGGFPMEDGWGKEYVTLTLATPYSLNEFPKLCRSLYRNGDVYLRRHWWHEAALKMSAPWFQRSFKFSSPFILKLRKKFRQRR
jgi:FMN phosphatase YigB (HAD superfamily)